MVLVFVEILAEHVTAYLEKHLFRSREEVLSDAASDIIPVIIRNFFLVIAPYFLLSLIDHDQSLLKCPSEQYSNVCR